VRLTTAEGLDALKLEQDGLTYALDRAPAGAKRSVVTVRVAGSDAPPFTDTAALLAFKGREALATTIAERFGREPGQVMGHLALLLDQVERAQALVDRPAVVVLTPERRAAAEALLSAPDLLDRAAAALDALGYVGEDATKRLAYLVATSRLLTKPLSAILMAPSGAGKSDLLDKLTLLLPAEAVEFLSRVTPSALYYAGPEALRHKVVVVDEQAGASDADYAIRTLQTKGLLRLALTVAGRTERFEAHGPIALLSGTTRSDLDPENLSRCLELPLDDSPEQTRRIQAAQRHAWAGHAREVVDTQLWQDAQRALEPLAVVIPFAERLDYPARTTKDRRDQQKLLALVAAHALLHQRQRERDEHGRVVASVGDYEAIHRLLIAVLQQTHDGLSPRAARVYRLLAESDRPLTRREIADKIGWNYMTSVRALDELVAQELAAVADKQAPRRYQLLAEPRLVDAAALTAPATLTPTTETFTSKRRARTKTSGARSQPSTGRWRRPDPP
jgi:DNA primase